MRDTYAASRNETDYAVVRLHPELEVGHSLVDIIKPDRDLDYLFAGYPAPAADDVCGNILGAAEMDGEPYEIVELKESGGKHERAEALGVRLPGRNNHYNRQ